MRIIILGPPGAGKGTQADFIQARFDIPKISTGDILRQRAKETDPLGQKIKAVVDSGDYVSDQIIIEILKDRIARPDCESGFILDGFPRTPEQAAALKEAGVHIDFVILLKIDDDQIIKRLSGRLVDPQTHQTYHIDNLPADVDRSKLMHRIDDDPETVRLRLKKYHVATEPLASWYQNEMARDHGEFLVIDGAAGVENVRDSILSQLAS